MITRVQIDGYKSFKNFELEMKPLMIIFGPNASGKSNLFDALQLISKATTEKNLKLAFDQHRGLPLESIYSSKGSLGSEDFPKRMDFEVDVHINNFIKELTEKNIFSIREGLEHAKSQKPMITERYLRYNMAIDVLRQGITRISQEKLCALRMLKPHIERKRKAFLETINNRIRIRMEGQAHPSEKDIGLDYTMISTAPYPPHHPHINAFRNELDHWRFYYLEPKTLMREDSPIKDVQYIGPKGEGLAGFYYTLNHSNPRQFEVLSKSLKLLLPGVDGVSLKQDREEGLVRILLKEGDVEFKAKLISEGSIRMLGLLAIIHAVEPATVVCYEEPENGVHTERLKLIADMFKNTQKNKGVQFIINTHSFEFVNYFDQENLFVCRKDHGQTKIEQLNSVEPLFLKELIRQGLKDPRI